MPCPWRQCVTLFTEELPWTPPSAVLVIYDDGPASSTHHILVKVRDRVVGDMSLAAAQTEPSGHGRIPVLDFGAYLAGEAGAAAPLARAIARTCEDTGFLVVVNHGVPQYLVDDTFAVAQNFFERPEPEKLALKIGKYNIGYLPFGGQVVRHSPVNKNTKPNFSESFSITRDRAPDHPDIVNEKPLVGLNRWPDDMPELPAATPADYQAMEAMTTRLVPLFALALDLPADDFSAPFSGPN